MDDDSSYLDGGVDNNAWTSPSKKLPIRASNTTTKQIQHKQGTNSNTWEGAKTSGSREQALRDELASVRKVNEAIEGVLESLEKAKSNMKNVNHTVNAASSLLNVWTRILSQTEHNQRLILDPSWEGASQDIQHMEDEAIVRQQAAERRDAEDQERRATAARKAEEEERKRAEAASKPKTAMRGRSGLGRSGSTRTATTANSSTAASGITRGLSSSRRAGSNIGRGVRGTRNRGT